MQECVLPSVLLEKLDVRTDIGARKVTVGVRLGSSVACGARAAPMPSHGISLAEDGTTTSPRDAPCQSGTSLGVAVAWPSEANSRVVH